MRARDHAPVSVSPAKTAELDDSKSSIQGAVRETRARGEGGGGVGLLPYIGYTDMCGWKEYGFQAIWSGIGSSNHRKLV